MDQSSAVEWICAWPLGKECPDRAKAGSDFCSFHATVADAEFRETGRVFSSRSPRRPWHDEDQDDWYDPDYPCGDIGDEYEQQECPEMKEASQHQIAIFDWLVTSGIARPLRDGRGFIVREGRPVRLQDGRLYDAVSWLSNEGFDGLLVRDLVATQHSPKPGTRQLHYVRFAKVEVLDAPFGENVRDVGDDDDIPFKR